MHFPTVLMWYLSRDEPKMLLARDAQLLELSHQPPPSRYSCHFCAEAVELAFL